MDAFDMYMEFLDKIGEEPEYFTYFAKFIRKVGAVYEIPEDIYDKIARQVNESIEYSILGDDSIELFGEKIQFGQVFYNLIINSIYAIRHSGKRVFRGVSKREE